MSLFTDKQNLREQSTHASPENTAAALVAEMSKFARVVSGAIAHVREHEFDMHRDLQIHGAK